MTEKFYSSEGSAGTSLLRDAHIGVEAISAAAALIKQEQWVEAERVLAELQAITAGLAKHVGEKARDAIKLPSPIKATADKRALVAQCPFSVG